MYKYIPFLLDLSPSSSSYPYLCKSFCFIVRCFALEQIAEQILFIKVMAIYNCYKENLSFQI